MRRRRLPAATAAAGSAARRHDQGERAEHDDEARGTKHSRTLAHATRRYRVGSGDTIHLDPWGARDSRAERVTGPRCGSATDPWNLHRVIPAKGDREIVDAPERAVALVFAGGDPVDSDVAAR